jgi:hypothetical protein
MYNRLSDMASGVIMREDWICDNFVIDIEKVDQVSSTTDIHRAFVLSF